jgi:predicted NAD/FAD-binding protein
MTSKPKRIAVVGSGIGGTSAAWHLCRLSQSASAAAAAGPDAPGTAGVAVDIFEAEPQLGGHAYNVELEGETVDLGFMMYGDSNPNIKAWFNDELRLTRPDGTTPRRVPMSMAVSSEIEGDVKEFSSRKPFAEKGSLRDARLWRILRDIFLFTKALVQRPPRDDTLSTAEWVALGEYSPDFYRNYFLPFVAILWTVPLDAVMALPASQFLRCLATHAHSLYVPPSEVVLGLLGKRAGGPCHKWWVMGSAYVPAVQAQVAAMQEGVGGGKGAGQLFLGHKVTGVTREEGGATGGLFFVHTDSADPAAAKAGPYDHVVMATHADTTADILGAPASTPGLMTGGKKAAAGSGGAVEAALRKHAYHASEMYLHRDASFMPAKKSQWASWNVRIMRDCDADASAADAAAAPEAYVLTYFLNRIQRLKTKKDVFVTIVLKEWRGRRPRPEHVLKHFGWCHPKRLLDCKPLAAVLGGGGGGSGGMVGGISLSGAWLGRGFHEDGFVAGRRAAIVALKAAGAPCSAPSPPSSDDGDYALYEGALDLEVPEPTGGAHGAAAGIGMAVTAVLVVALAAVVYRQFGLLR